MAYDTDKLYKRALKEIKDNNLYFASDVYTSLGVSVSTFYDHFPKGSFEYTEISNHLSSNRVSGFARDRVLDKKRHKGDGYVYIVKCGDFNLYKIGISKAKPRIRLSALQSGCPFPLTMTHVFYCTHYSLLEYEIHERYKDCNKMGEWFSLTDQQLLCVISEIEQQARKQLGLF